MKFITRLVLLYGLFVSSTHAYECSPLLDIDVRKLNGDESVNLCRAYQGKVILIVNTASRCAYTDQYDALEKLYGEYRDEGLVVLGFPSNDFGNQEPGTEQEIRDFCRYTYGVKFPMFAKTKVLERNADPLYHRLAGAAGTYPKWNFHKYLIDVDGEMVTSFHSAIDPLDPVIVDRIRQELSRSR